MWRNFDVREDAEQTRRTDHSADDGVLQRLRGVVYTAERVDCPERLEQLSQSRSPMGINTAGESPIGKIKN